ncbi:Hypothetical lipoprotein [Leptospira biflexa serovar Patoc strain 'Patoc 1 (Ames)']|uniref:Lipoprotein n=1 Tax=Leptospira biflexa serovar Patoc (strain Patoc 1 / ATCC 23582 / Paris) TaxID=456481 RepID=B0ST17_LEPBP|nr:hypothetical protein [Leptospira biflexa]ABZ94595.1 Hypothetical lipoprotein [Leptospira biflexa serovar Patoc strain 'Patoc 1 (Ames)']ABZ98257.1 Hypothetical protein; putative signal peptide [Leptospira biflexa serovar Patoc strain 'Patoc 1 (Paris)']
MRVLLLSVLFLFFSIQCTSLAKRKDYEESLQFYKKVEIDNAITSLPRNERRGFIAVLEKAHLSFLNGGTKFSDLESLAEESKERLRFSATRSLKSFFYMESEDGYYASEAEIIYLHILLGLYYARVEDYEKAKIQARYAGNLLSGEWSAEGQFDDPTLRLLLASLWLTTGAKEEAMVDFRKATQLKPQSHSIRSFAMEMVPTDGEFIFIFGGPGAEPEMEPSANLNFIRGLRNLKFRASGNQSTLLLVDQSKTMTLSLEKGTLGWYERHLIRDNEISELIQDSKYFQLISATAIKEGTKGTLKVTGSILASATIIALGAGMVYVGAEVNSEDLAGLGIITIIAGFQLGSEWVSASVRQTKENIKEDLDISNEYRYVRFFPEYVWIGKSKTKLKSPILTSNKGPVTYHLTPAMGKIKVRFGFVPDVQNP